MQHLPTSCAVACLSIAPVMPSELPWDSTLTAHWRRFTSVNSTHSSAAPYSPLRNNPPPANLKCNGCLVRCRTLQLRGKLSLPPAPKLARSAVRRSDVLPFVPYFPTWV